MKRNRVLILFFVLLLTACGATIQPTVGSAETSSHMLTVFAATSLTEAFTEIGRAFEADHPGVSIVFNFANAQALRTQIEEGASVDVFASANTKEMDTLVANGLVDKNVPKIFLTNKLVVILPADNPAALEKLEDLGTPGIKLVLAAEEVPVGEYARQSFEQMNVSFGTDFKDKVLANVVSNEDNVKQVVSKIQLGEADAGIVYTSDAVAAPELKTIEIPDNLNIIAKYPLAPLTKSANVDLATQFVEYVLSTEAQGTLQKWGFGPIQ